MNLMALSISCPDADHLVRIVTDSERSVGELATKFREPAYAINRLPSSRIASCARLSSFEQTSNQQRALSKPKQTHHKRKRMAKKHEWRENTDDGEVRLVTATRHAGKWKLRARLKSEAEWTDYPVIPLEDLESLHEIVANKAQRQRVPFEHVAEIEKLIAGAKSR